MIENWHEPAWAISAEATFQFESMSGGMGTPWAGSYILELLNVKVVNKNLRFCDLPVVPVQEATKEWVISDLSKLRFSKSTNWNDNFDEFVMKLIVRIIVRPVYGYFVNVVQFIRHLQYRYLSWNYKTNQLSLKFNLSSKTKNILWCLKIKKTWKIQSQSYVEMFSNQPLL